MIIIRSSEVFRRRNEVSRQSLAVVHKNMPILCYGYESDGYEVASNVELDYSDYDNRVQGVVITPKSRW